VVAILIKFNIMNLKEYKRSRGLGDTIERFTKATGIKKVVDAVAKATGKDCGCNKRKETLNKKFPYKK
tara:strand:+ start:40 stop:243 length:204 start_codon:yes stop_codon:yes gene_type:complete